MKLKEVIETLETLKESKGNGYIVLTTDKDDYVVSRSNTLKVLDKTTIGIKVEKSREEITQMHVGELLLRVRSLGERVLEANIKFYSEKSPTEFNHAEYVIGLKGVKNG